jgi:malate dehydrogenase
VHVTDVKNVIIWGNHSSTQYPDVNHATVGGKPVREALAKDGAWLDGEFVAVVQQRGAAIIKARRGLGRRGARAANWPVGAVCRPHALTPPTPHSLAAALPAPTPNLKPPPRPQARGLSSAMSAASSACDHVRDWLLGTPAGTWVSMGVYSDGSYGQPKGLVYSFPCTCEAGGKWKIVQVGRAGGGGGGAGLGAGGGGALGRACGGARAQRHRGTPQARIMSFISL